MKEEDKIKLGQCVSPLTVDKCPICVDTCEASEYYSKLQKELNKNNIKRTLNP